MHPLHQRYMVSPRRRLESTLLLLPRKLSSLPYSSFYFFSFPFLSPQHLFPNPNTIPNLCLLNKGMFKFITHGNLLQIHIGLNARKDKGPVFRLSRPNNYVQGELLLGNLSVTTIYRHKSTQICDG